MEDRESVTFRRFGRKQQIVHLFRAQSLLSLKFLRAVAESNVRVIGRDDDPTLKNEVIVVKGGKRVDYDSVFLEKIKQSLS